MTVEENKPLHKLVIIDIFGVASGFLVLPHYSDRNLNNTHSVVLRFGFKNFEEFTDTYPGGVSGYSDMNKVMLESKFPHDDPGDLYERVISADTAIAGLELDVVNSKIEESIKYDGGQIFMLMPTVKTFSKLNYYKKKPIPYEDMWFCRNWREKRK